MIDQNILTLNTRSLKLSDEEFFKFCLDNESLRIERHADQNIIIMSPTGSKSGKYNLKIGSMVLYWAETQNLEVFDSSTGFTLPNGAVRSPDVAVIRKEKWDRLTNQEQEKFAPICPGFVIEIVSPSDDLNYLHQKMKEYLANGTELGWLIDPQSQKVWIYDHRKPDPEVLDGLDRVLTGKYVMEGFELDLGKVFE